MIALLLQSNIPSTAYQPGAPVEKGWAEKAGKKKSGKQAKERVCTTRCQQAAGPPGSRSSGSQRWELGWKWKEPSRTPGSWLICSITLHSFILLPFTHSPVPHLPLEVWGMQSKTYLPREAARKETAPLLLKRDCQHLTIFLQHWNIQGCLLKCILHPSGSCPQACKSSF